MPLLLRSCPYHTLVFLRFPTNPRSLSLFATNAEMAEAQQASNRKRFREENDAEEEQEEEEAKRRSCSYRNIISLLESEEEDPAQEDLSSLISSLQQELSSCDDSHRAFAAADHSALSPSRQTEQGSEALEEMATMRRLLHASDDELGIPTAGNEGRFEEAEEEGEQMAGGISKYDGFWEMEDEAANYHTLLQSELFM